MNRLNELFSRKKEPILSIYFTAGYPQLSSTLDIAEALEKAGQPIDRKFITSGIVKRTGKYNASVRLHRDVVIELPYEIVAEK